LCPSSVRVVATFSGIVKNCKFYNAVFWVTITYNVVGGYYIFEEIPLLASSRQKSGPEDGSKELFRNTGTPTNRNVQCPNPFDSRPNMLLTVSPGYKSN